MVLEKAKQSVCFHRSHNTSKLFRTGTETKHKVCIGSLNSCKISNNTRKEERQTVSHYGKKDGEFRNGIEERRVKAVIEFDYLTVSLTRLTLKAFTEH